jgi:hypothetical protein
LIRKKKTTAEEKLDLVRQLLFPDLKLEEELDKNGELIKYHIDYSVDSNLDAALLDLMDGSNDAVTHKTINSVIKRLYRVRKILNAEAKIHKDSKYLIVDGGEENNIEDITAAED